MFYVRMYVCIMYLVVYSTSLTPDHPSSLVELLKQLSSQLDGTVDIPLRREHILVDALRAVTRASFSCSKSVCVS